MPAQSDKSDKPTRSDKAPSPATVAEKIRKAPIREIREQRVLDPRTGKVTPIKVGVISRGTVEEPTAEAPQ